MPTGQMRSVDARRFAMVPRNDVPRSAFDVSHTHKTTFPAGYLIPVFVEEVLPGDSISVRMHAFARLATAIVPFMDNLILESFFFFTPNRIVWNNWERFMGEQASLTDITDFVTPQVVPTWNDVILSIFDYMGITLNGAGAGSVSVNALPFRAYNLIYNDWFRDEDLAVKMAENQASDGPDAVANYFLCRRGKRHDYFTSARPWPQKPIMQPNIGGYTSGDELRNLQPGGDFLFTQFSATNNIGAPVTGIGVGGAAATTAGPSSFKTPGNRGGTWDPFYTSTTAPVALRAGTTNAAPDVKVLINDIRTAFMFQTWQEKNARGGTRYAEIVRSHFGVISPDARLQRPEYLGGGRTFVSVNPVAQTSATGLAGGSTPLGDQAANGTFSAYNHGFSSSFTEHGIILGLVNVRADLTYQQGIRRMWFRKSKFDYYWPSMAHLGEQAVFSKEVFNDGTAGDDDVFGYQERWAEYRYSPNRTSAAFRSQYATPLDMFHLGQEFAARPVLNQSFIEEDPPVGRVLVTSAFASQQFMMDILFQERMVRAMPMFSIPGIGTRF